MNSLLLGAVVLGATGLTVYLALGVLGRRMHEGVPRRLERMYLRAGVDPQRLRSGALGTERARAERICAGCLKAPRCRRWFDSGEVEGFQSFCPVALFVEGLRHKEMRHKES